MLGQSQTVTYNSKSIMDATDAERQQMLRQMGVINADPPLPHSPCLKVIKTGVVHPWNELLAQQRDLVVCCDEKGNTDPAAWESKVIYETTTNAMLSLLAQQAVFKQDNPYERGTIKVKQVVGPTDYEQHNVIPYSEIQALQEKLHANKPADTGSIAGPERSSSGE